MNQIEDMPIEETIATCVNRVRQNINQFGEAFPHIWVDEDKRYALGGNDHWMTAFWTGQLWLSYVWTEEMLFKNAAEARLNSFRERLYKEVKLTHDLGFLYTLSANAQWRLTQSEAAHHLALEAAEALTKRFNPNGKYIQAWGAIGQGVEAGRFIIDCMMNLPLLFWAGQSAGDSSFTDIALLHAETTQRYLIRSDYSTAHTFFINPETGEPEGEKTHQGYRDDSLWSRGQAWAIYGFALAANWTGRQDFLLTAKNLSDRFLTELTADYVPLWDFRLTQAAPQYPDTSAGAIASMGLWHLANLLKDDADFYRSEAEKLLTALIQTGFHQNGETSIQGLLDHSTQNANEANRNDCYTLFGDYFFLEALINLSGTSIDFWGTPDPV